MAASMATTKVPNETIERAVKALLKWKSSKSETQKPQLLSSDEFLYFVLTLHKIPSKGRTNAYKIPIPNPLFTNGDSEICLIIDDRNLTSKSAKQKVLEEQIPVSKILKFTKLKTDYKPFEGKRKLCDSYDLFFADKRIIPLLPRVIGKHFYKKKKIPVPIELGRKNWKEQIARVFGSALLFVNTGTCTVIKVAKNSMEEEEIVENVMAVVNGVAEFVPKKWGNVRSIHLKFSDSVALPVYHSVPEMKMKIGGMVVGKENVESLESDEDGESEKKSESKKVSKKKGRIHEVRYMDNIGYGDLVGANESGSENDGELMADEGENSGKKRKKDDEEKKVKKKVPKMKKAEKGDEEKVMKAEKGLKQKKANVLGKRMTEKKSKKSKAFV